MLLQIILLNDCRLYSACTRIHFPKKPENIYVFLKGSNKSLVQSRYEGVVGLGVKNPYH